VESLPEGVSSSALRDFAPKQLDELIARRTSAHDEIRKERKRLSGAEAGYGLPVGPFDVCGTQQQEPKVIHAMNITVSLQD